MKQIFCFLKKIRLFNILTDQELYSLAKSAREIPLSPLERIIIEGRPGTSLFLVAEGELEVLKRQPTGEDQRIGKLNPGDIFGEFSLLTGEPRFATIRSMKRSIIFEIGKEQYKPIIKKRPEIIDALSLIMLERIHYPKKKAPSLDEIKQKIYAFFFPK